MLTLVLALPLLPALVEVLLLLLLLLLPPPLGATAVHLFQHPWHCREHHVHLYVAVVKHQPAPPCLAVVANHSCRQPDCIPRHHLEHHHAGPLHGTRHYAVVKMQAT
jgi:hypothetical protein